MRIILSASCLVLLWAGTASAQVHVVVQVPSIRWVAPPPMVVVAPGVRVVEDYDEEVFFQGGWYWYRDGGNWYRSHDHHGNWVGVPGPRVPPRLMQLPPGHYRHFKGANRPAKMDNRGQNMKRRGGEPVHGPGGGPVRGGGPKNGNHQGNGHGNGHGRR